MMRRKTYETYSVGIVDNWNCFEYIRPSFGSSDDLAVIAMMKKFDWHQKYQVDSGCKTSNTKKKI